MVVSRLLPSSTVMTPSLPTLSIASAMSLPIWASWLALAVPTFATSSESFTSRLIFFSSATMASVAIWMPR